MGTPWTGFDLANTVAIAPAAEPIEVFVLSDIVDGTRLEVPAGGAVPNTSVPSSSSPSTTSTTTTTTTSPPSSVPSGNQNVTSLGQVTASSEYSAEFATGLAVDGDQTTSWFSDGVPGGDTEVYEWDAGSEITIDRVTIVGNGANADPSIRSGYGFDAVTVEILDGGGKVVSTGELDLSGTPDPDVAIEPHVLGRRIRLTFRGHESPDCGGFAELVVEGLVPVG